MVRISSGSLRLEVLEAGGGGGGGEGMLEVEATKSLRRSLSFPDSMSDEDRDAELSVPFNESSAPEGQMVISLPEICGPEEFSLWSPVASGEDFKEGICK